MRNLRRFLAMALTIMMVAGCFSMFSVNAFDDVYDFEDAINTLSDLGVIRGYDETSFGPDDDVLRWHMALLVSKLVTGKVETETWETSSNYSNFTDVKAENYYGSISYAANNGIIIGTTETTFEPEGQIMYQDALTMVVRALGFGGEEMDAGYPFTYIAKATKLGLTEGLEYIEDYTEYLTRGETAQLLFNALYVPTADGASFAEKSFGMEAADGMTVVITATNDANMVSDTFVEKNDYVAFNEITEDGTLNLDVTYFVNKAEFGIEGDPYMFVGSSYKVFSTDGYKSFVTCEKIDAVNVTVEGFAEKNAALVSIDDTVYQVVESYTALNSSKVNKGNYPEIIMMDVDQGYQTGNGNFVTDAKGNLLNANGRIVLYYMPDLVGYVNPYVVIDGAVTRQATFADFADVAIVNGRGVSAFKVIADTNAEIVADGAIYDAVAFDDDGDGIYDRALYRNYAFGLYTEYNNAAGVPCVAIGGIGATDWPVANTRIIDSEGNAFTPVPGTYYIYAYNWQSHTLVIKDTLTVYTGYVSGINTLKNTVTIGGTVYNYGVANLPGAGAAQVGVTPELVGKNVNYVLSADGVVLAILDLADCGYIVFDSVIGVTSSGLPTVLVYNNSNIASVIVVATIDSYSYYQFSYNPDYLNSNIALLQNTDKGTIFTAEVDALGYYHLYTVADVTVATGDFDVDFINGITNDVEELGGRFKTTADTVILVFNPETNTFIARKGIPADGAQLAVSAGSTYFVKTAGNAITYLYVYGDATFTGNTVTPAWNPVTVNTTVVYIDPDFAEPTIVSNSLASVIGVEGLALQGYTYKYNAVDMKTGAVIEVYTASYNARLTAGCFYTVTNGYVDRIVDIEAADSPIKAAQILAVGPFYSETTNEVYDRQDVVILEFNSINGKITKDANGNPVNFFGNADFDAVGMYALYYEGIGDIVKVYLTSASPIGVPVQVLSDGSMNGSVGAWAYTTEASDDNGAYVTATANTPVVAFTAYKSLDLSKFFSSSSARIHLEIYVDDASKIVHGQFEFNSNNTTDNYEMKIDMAALGLQSGWNTIDAPVSSILSRGEGAMEMNTAAYTNSRLYVGATEGTEITIGVRNVYFYDLEANLPE